MPPQAPQGPPAPDDGQTVAALRHFHALEKEFTGLLADPKIGKSDMKSAIIEGATRLVANRIISPAQAVTQLSQVPERPFEQRQWAQKNLAQIVQAQHAVLAHHAAAYRGMPESQVQAMSSKADPDDHMATISGLMNSHYGRR
jgi:hypothetical protein